MEKFPGDDNKQIGNKERHYLSSLPSPSAFQMAT